MDKKWIKNGVFASDTVKLNGCVVCNPTEDMLKAAGYEEYQEPEQTDEEKLAQAKQQKLAEIYNYDASDEVNSFLLDGISRWLDKSMRQSLTYTAKILQENGGGHMIIWFDTTSVELTLVQALSILEDLEIYAKKTNDITHQHRAEVEALTSISEIQSYDITKGYPDKPEYNSL